MLKKVLRYVVLGIGVYALIATLVMTFYKDDPGSMVWQDREAYNKRFIASLDSADSMPIEEVLDTLGTPDLTFVKRRGDDIYQIVFYRTQHKKADGITTKDECTGLLFKNKKLLVWGQQAELAYDKVDLQS
ncbi:MULTISPECIES: DUF3192 domain-containing protein [Pseudoalteromonas]|uniref:DUF3192 domain-containing protein n=1 Tax=Pseudoalteromonas ruthenica TaxID=151081 RepID=A0A0F4PKX0_9GAMM|nr:MULTISPECIES: DUF3192 domain-containing protein [Pseudoalteromonas]KJY95633.1 hypothetical protein TW76_13660 [Pseudoalteromonas ruthenica]KJZ00479.1 hypothetical protein TW72_07285 [Pseudoalteromonas ruthenica]MCG7544158.1 DUF3192 domain-containing protein [Pseudoalteromonas sp. MM17-2]MCG7565621.1 DUF3192 domain-containing protein [Pseudoalteromonas sp. CnMc7-15]MCG7569240.1 DUF3192 domain-containing protein [Pseudoalteromonas sp. CNC9-20]|tara:strand:- start:484 stop:876 length:393 start_codon:yes stop_codon:yes gene_type:complete